MALTRESLSKGMKEKHYTVSKETAQSLSNCVEALWDGSSNGASARSCERAAMGKKFEPGTTAASFAGKWGSK